MSLDHTTVLRCDMCPITVTWERSVSHSMARKTAKERYGWRTDKLNRDICSRHPRITNRKKKETGHE